MYHQCDEDVNRLGGHRSVIHILKNENYNYVDIIFPISAPAVGRVPHLILNCAQLLWTRTLLSPLQANLHDLLTQ